MGVAVFFPATFGVTLLAGGGADGALALAAYGSFFGGLGFGAMLGGVVNLVRLEEAEAAAQEQPTTVAPESGPVPEDPARPLDVAA